MATPAVTVIVAAATILPIALILHGPPKLALSVPAWGGIIGQGLVSTLLATALWQFGVAQVGSASAGVFMNIEPLMGSTLGVALFGDHLTKTLALGGALIIVGSSVVMLGERGGAAPIPSGGLSEPDAIL
jgi:drug/metabolite transporter (DMT)-like permease